MAAKSKINVFWFRRDLRLEDNHALFKALIGPRPVLPIFIFDTDILDKLSDRHDRRVDFIFQRLQQINLVLKNNRRNLHIFHDQPKSVFQELVKRFDIETVFCNRDYEPSALIRDRKIEHLLRVHSIGFESFKDQVIFEKDEIQKADGLPYTVYTPYRRQWEKRLSGADLTCYPSGEHLDKIYPLKPTRTITLKELGFHKTDLIIDAPKIDTEIINRYDQRRDIPSVAGTSRLSVHLRFGTVSIRELVRAALELNDTWLGELIWREFFMMILYHFPQVVDNPFRAKYKRMRWLGDEEGFTRWTNGETGFPIVDAGMRELNTTGFMHNRVRMICAGFLTKHLLIDWRLGEGYFARKLLDYDLAANNGNWQWAAGCGCDAAPYFRIFNPTAQAKKFDPQGIYINRWIPELNTPKYPEPIVEHSFARQRALDAFRQV